MLTIVATPIGNLQDLSQRAILALQEADAILCEDTRHSGVLLTHFGIRKPLYSYHKFKERQALEPILQDLAAGKKLALISDAGTPCINDPGLILVQACIERNLPFSAVPGPCSLIQALVLTGFETSRFQFLGFLPRKPAETLRQALCYPGTSLAFESPERLVDTLEEIQELDPKRQVAVARELTKTFEECRRGTAVELLTHYRARPPRGEIVLAIAPGKLPEEELPLEELVHMLQELHGFSLKEAIKQAAHFLKRPKSEVYREIHNIRAKEV